MRSFFTSISHNGTRTKAFARHIETLLGTNKKGTSLISLPQKKIMDMYGVFGVLSPSAPFL